MSTNPTLTTSEPLNLAIIGGSFSSVALAIALLKDPSLPIKVTIFESAPAFSEIGAGVAFGPNAIRAIHLISKDLWNAWEKCASFSEREDLKDTWLTYRWGKDDLEKGRKAGDLIYKVKGDMAEVEGKKIPMRGGAHRGKLLSEMTKLIPEGMARFSKCLVDIEDAEDGRVVLEFADGEKVVVDAVVGCDGIKSATRKYVMRNQSKIEEPKFTGTYAYRSFVPREVVCKHLGDELALNGQLYLGDHGHIISYPVEHGDFVNLAAVRTADDMQWSSKENWLKPSSKEEVLYDFKGWGAGLIDLIADFGTRDKWGIFDLEHGSNYNYGRVCLLGDSAHAATPNIGAGASMAFEDAYVMSGLLAGVKKDNDVKDAFRAFDAVRRKRTQKLVRTSRTQGKVADLVMEGIGDDADKIRNHTDAAHIVSFFNPLN